MPEDTTPHPETRKTIDWEAVKLEYEAGQLSNRVLGTMFGCSEAMIRKKAKAEKWARNLAAQVRRRASDELVRDAGPKPVRKSDAPGVESQVAQGGSQGAQSANCEPERDPEDDEAAIEAAAQRVVALVREHRKDLRGMRQMAQRLLDELSTTTSQLGELEQMIVEETSGDRTTQRRTSMLRAISLPSRASTLQALSIAMSKLVILERQAFNVDDEKGNGRRTDVPLEDRLKAYAREKQIDESENVVRMKEATA